jgi:hypothetical protein
VSYTNLSSLIISVKSFPLKSFNLSKEFSTKIIQSQYSFSTKIIKSQQSFFNKNHSHSVIEFKTAQSRVSSHTKNPITIHRDKKHYHNHLDFMTLPPLVFHSFQSKRIAIQSQTSCSICLACLHFKSQRSPQKKFFPKNFLQQNKKFVTFRATS